ncbi:MAG: diguanylate cyclase [Steroidobacteraceae bacterium]|jgi:diguanylate cyclase (GGDEF)-like protein
MPNHLNLDDFPSSPYAYELRQGIERLRFAPALEAEYRAVHLQRVRLRVRIWFSLTAALAILFTINQLRLAGSSSLASLAHLYLLLPCTFALVWLAWTPHYERLYLLAARVLVTLYGTLIAVFIAIALSEGRTELLASLTVNLMAVFFFSGLMFRHAIVTALIMLLGFALAALAVHLPAAMLIKSLVITSLSSGIAAIVYRDVELAYRRNFLEDALISDLVAHDALTGLMNRRAFDEHLLRVWQHALRDQRLIAVLMIDIDHFKLCNDRWGHQAGDVALRHVGKIIQGFARRPLDLAARFGGEEFAVILYDLALPHVEDIAERLREGVQKMRITGAGSDGEGPEVTVSVGVGLAAPEIGRTPQGIVQLADEALYAAKNAGRNRVVVKGIEAYVLLNTGAFNTPSDSRRRQ